jgi:hypothetical protein
MKAAMVKRAMNAPIFPKLRGMIEPRSLPDGH